MIVSSRQYIDAPSLIGHNSTKRLEFENRVARHVGGIRRLARLASELHPVRCQTCHDPLGDVAEICADRIWVPDEIIFTLHHPSCRSGQTILGHHQPPASAPSADAAAFLLPPGRSRWASAGPTVIVVVNPSCEQVIARRVGALRRARNTALDDLRPLAFSRSRRRIAKLTGIRATVNESSLVIKAPTVHQPLKRPEVAVYGGIKRQWDWNLYGEPAPTLAQTWMVEELSADVQQALETTHELVVAATTRYLPTQLTQATLDKGLSSPGLLVGQAQVR